MVKLPFLRTPYNYDMNVVSDETGLACKDPSLTQQSFAAEADINTIVDRFMKSGVLPDPVSMPQYIDYEGVFDFQSAMNVIRQADENFARLDARVRARFQNSPQAFLEFFSNPANQDEAIRLGLALPNKGDPQAGAGAVGAAPVSQADKPLTA